MICKSNVMTKAMAREILSSPKNTYLRHKERKVTKLSPGLYEMEMPNFYLIGELDEAIDFLFI